MGSSIPIGYRDGDVNRFPMGMGTGMGMMLRNGDGDATDRGIPVMSDGCHANVSKFSFRSEHSSVRPFADSVPSIATS
ncbi:hypothetical protein Tco_0309537 [Tanacetum coccineum]